MGMVILEGMKGKVIVGVVRGGGGKKWVKMLGIVGRVIE